MNPSENLKLNPTLPPTPPPQMRNGNIEWGNDSFLRLFELTPEILREAFPQSADFSGVWLLELFSPSKEAISKVRTGMFPLFHQLKVGPQPDV